MNKQKSRGGKFFDKGDDIYIPSEASETSVGNQNRDRNYVFLLYLVTA